jgi:hypothetical protein
MAKEEEENENDEHAAAAAAAAVACTAATAEVSRVRELALESQLEAAKAVVGALKRECATARQLQQEAEDRADSLVAGLCSGSGGGASGGGGVGDGSGRWPSSSSSSPTARNDGDLFGRHSHDSGDSLEDLGAMVGEVLGTEKEKESSSSFYSPPYGNRKGQQGGHALARFRGVNNQSGGSSGGGDADLFIEGTPSKNRLNYGGGSNGDNGGGTKGKNTAAASNTGLGGGLSSLSALAAVSGAASSAAASNAFAFAALVESAEATELRNELEEARQHLMQSTRKLGLGKAALSQQEAETAELRRKLAQVEWVVGGL